jgi:hypothetical protein
MDQPFSAHRTSTFPRLADRVIRAGAIYSMAADRTVLRAIALQRAERESAGD